MAAAKEKTCLRLATCLTTLLLLLAALAAPASASSAPENRTWEKSALPPESLHSQPLQLPEPHQIKAAVRGYDAPDDSLAAESAGPLAKANFAQKDFGNAFSSEPGALFPGKTIDDVAGALSAGKLTPADVPVQYIVRDGNTLILNTRSAQALEQAGIPRSRWNAINMTGNAKAEARLTAQLQRNGLTSQGTPTVTPRQGN